MQFVTCPSCTRPISTSPLQSHWDEPTQLRYTLHECDGCHLQHWEPLIHPSAAYYESEQVDLYARIHATERRAEDDPRYRYFGEDFPRLDGLHVLDIGCSDGIFLRFASERGAAAKGIDIDAKGVALAKSRGFNAERIALPDFVERTAPRSFDMVCLFDVLEHTVDPAEFLRLARKLLKPGGQLVGTVPNRDRLLRDWVTTDFPPHHFVRFDPESLTSCIRAADFEVDRVDTFEFGYALPVALAAGLKSARRLRSELETRFRNTRRATVHSAEPAPRDGYPQKQNALRDVIVDTLTHVSARAERAVGRGFKLYFRANSKPSVDA